MLLSKKPICDPKGNQFEELLLDRSKPLKTAEYFGLLFEQPPTYEELLSGTPKLASIFALKSTFDRSNIPIGEGGGNRTHDTLVKSQLLYH